MHLRLAFQNHDPRVGGSSSSSDMTRACRSRASPSDELKVAEVGVVAQAEGVLPRMSRATERRFGG
jgi:hypothetical protein